MYVCISRLTIVSCEARPYATGHMRQMSVLFTCSSTTVKFVNALNKPPLKPSFVIKDSAPSNYIKSVTQQWRKLAPPILSTSHCELASFTVPTTLEKPSSWHPFTYLLEQVDVLPSKNQAMCDLIYKVIINGWLCHVSETHHLGKGAMRCL